ncbi:class I SAM-dependent methyltransferase [Streptomyces sp. NPDC004787]|uniref:class I SAM-dependent methyltransferase n=1 Tax=Streptomyces sp. NPDC004787 TaxID=3154291 RepID=UPI0033A1A640
MSDENMPSTSSPAPGSAPGPEASPASAPESGGSRAASSCVVGALGCAGVALLGVVVLVGALVWHSWGSTDFPRVAPEEMASRAVERSREAYEVLGFSRTIRPGVADIGVSTQNTLGSEPCHDGGLLGMEDGTVDGAYSMHHSWALDHVTASQAEAGLRRLHRHLKDQGWEITSYREGGPGKDWDLFVQRDDGAERMSFTWYRDREYFTGGASVPCAYDPAWQTGDTGTPGEHLRPPAFPPAR